VLIWKVTVNAKGKYVHAEQVAGNTFGALDAAAREMAVESKIAAEHTALVVHPTIPSVSQYLPVHFAGTLNRYRQSWKFS